MPSRRRSTAAHPTSGCTRSTSHGRSKSRASESCPVSGHHSERFEVTGYRIGRMAYLTDFKTIADAEVGKLIGVELLVVNALRFRPHPSHFNVEEALALIARVAPRRALITHVSHEIGRHAATTALLPRGVELAYDGLEIII